WWWIRPLRRLVDACRARALDPSLPLPAIAAPEEAAVLRDALQALLAAERSARERLAQSLERETTANTVHQRFLARLGLEFGQPIRQLTAAMEDMRTHGGRLEPERLAETLATALALEDRLHEVLGLAAERVDTPARALIPLDRFLTDLAAALRPKAQRAGVAIAVTAPTTATAIDAPLLSPILVNLAANGIDAAAGRAGASVTLTASAEDATVRWTIADNGPGIAPALAARIAAACTAGEAMPAEPGIGLGLALALANARALGGRIALERNGPDGVSFAVVTPVDAASPLPPAAPAAPSRA
ncbi:MAG: HAMP domain-containing histidine kinase, partial [Planctomycetes bacterium]|nr:HAMP domain-containing histidine kinase [Planctomycetota bacterium]